ncbi:MAG TPA: protein lplB, partial [Treponema sp.]|nr:protein lplB [Treponema sp.]
MKNKKKEQPAAGIQKTFLQRFREEKYLQLMALCGIAWMLVFNYAPMYGILIAFKKNFYITTPLFSKKFL